MYDNSDKEGNENIVYWVIKKNSLTILEKENKNE
jgi:hypothetical protein